MANNRLSHTDQSTPSIPGYNPGGDDFCIIRNMDGHLTQDDAERDYQDLANAHCPSQSSATPRASHPTSPGASTADDF